MFEGIIPKQKDIKIGNMVYLDYTNDNDHKSLCGKKLVITGVDMFGRIFCDYQGKIVILNSENKKDGFFCING